MANICEQSCDFWSAPARNLVLAEPLSGQCKHERSVQMLNLKQVRRIGIAALIASVPLLQASAQTTPPASEPPSATPPAAKPAPMPPSATAPSKPDKSVTAPGKVDPLIGLNVLSSDGSKLGAVQSVKSATDGKAQEIHIKTGGFLGFGGRLVAIPENKFTRKGDTIQVQMTADEVSKLPELKEQS
jgi:hypothetical protein